MILVFSGTGNSLAVAESLGVRLGMDVILLRSPLIGEASPEFPVMEGEEVIWVSPVYSWGLPGVVANFMSRAVFSGNPRQHLVLTYGDDCGLTPEQWRGIIGPSAAAAFGVRMPNTYVSFPGFDVDSPEVEGRKLGAYQERVEEIASKIEGGFNGTDVRRGGAAWLKSRVVYPSFIKHCSRTEKFHVAECVHCGMCAKVCPMGNVRLETEGPEWGKDCTGCLACYHSCPVHAINYGRFTRRKGQYRHFLRKNAEFFEKNR